MGFYAVGSKVFWLLSTMQTASVCDYQAGVCMTERKKVYQHKKAAHIAALPQTPRQTDILTPLLPQDFTDTHMGRWHDRESLVFCLTNVISSNKQRRHRSNICQCRPSLARWDSKLEPNPLWCCWRKWVTRATLSRMSAFSLLLCNSIPVLNQDLRLHRPTCSLSN